MEYPRIKIVSDGLTHGEHTKILTPDKEGNWVEITQAVSEIKLTMRAGDINVAKIKAVLVGAEVDALVTEMETKVLPPPVPKTQYRFRITEGFGPENAWTLERLTPLPTYGTEEKFIYGGAIAKNVPLLEIVGDAE